MRTLLLVALILGCIHVNGQSDFRDLVINEIYFDNSPAAAGFPNREFIEIYNATDEAINLSDFTVNEKSIDDYELPAGQYVAVGKSSIVTDFTEAGIPVVKATSFPTLLNSGMSLILRDPEGNVIDSLIYSTDWYQDDEKDNGGYTLEQINPLLVCSDAQNWVVSESEDGGTPGVINSVHDVSLKSAQVINVVPIESNQLLLTFDKPMSESNLTVAVWEIDQGLEVLAAELVDFYHLRLSMEGRFVDRQVYQLSWSEVVDCEGRILLAGSYSFEYDQSSPIITELTFRSFNTLKVYFDEAINDVDIDEEAFYINQEIGYAQNIEVESNQVFLEFENDLTIDQNYTLRVEGIEDLRGNEIIEPIEFDFTFIDQVDTVRVLSSTHLTLRFTKEVDESSATNFTNYHLEGQSPVSAFMDQSSDREVHLLFQTVFESNEELYLEIENILHDELGKMQTLTQVFVHDTKAPKLLGVEVLSANSLLVQFDEPTERVAAESPEHYELDDVYPLYAQQQMDLSEVMLVFENDFEQETSYQLFVGNMIDRSGNQMSRRSSEKFVYDTRPPILDSAFVSAPDIIQLIFHEPLDQATVEHANSYGLGSLELDSVRGDAEHHQIVRLYVANELPFLSFDITISDVQDLQGNEIDPIKAELDNTSLRIGELYPTDHQTLFMQFNHSVEQFADQLKASEINDVASIDSIAIEDFKVYFFLNESLILGGNQLTLSNELVEEVDYSFIYDPKLESVVTPNEFTVELTYEVALSNDFTVQDFHLSEVGNLITALLVDETTIRLSFDQSILPNQSYTLAVSPLTNTFGNVVAGFERAIIRDMLPPELKSVEVSNEHVLRLVFSEVLDQSSAELTNNYYLNDQFRPADLVYADSVVTLTFSEQFSEGLNTLEVYQAKDLEGNLVENIRSEFEYTSPYRPKLNELIITEIMANPEEGEPEFFELYNASNQDITLRGLTFSDGTSSTTFDSGVISRGEYLTVFQFINDSTVYRSSIEKWLTLNNGGETLTIDYEGELIYSVSYTDDWYLSTDYAAGGYSLEMIDRSNSCNAKENWTSSLVKGGTPNVQNSVDGQRPDNFPPGLLRLNVISETQIQLTFDEGVYALGQGIAVDIEPTLAIDSIIIDDLARENLNVRFSSPLLASQEYTVWVSGLSDCSGNTWSEPIASSFYLPEAADSLDILVNEVLFNPKSGGVDFVELYNHSDKVIDLTGWYIADDSQELKTVTNEPTVLLPSTFLVLTDDVDQLISQYPAIDVTRCLEVKALPGFNEDIDHVTIYDENRKVIDHLEYDEDYHSDLLRDVEGVSLERISYDAETNLPASWQSAASTVGFATPTQVNSQYMESASLSSTIEIHPKVFFPDQNGMDDFTTIQYKLGTQGSVTNIKIYTVQGQRIRTVAENQSLASSGFFKWDGTNDDGQLMPVGYYIVWVELFNTTGEKQVFKETVVLGARL